MESNALSSKENSRTWWINSLHQVYFVSGPLHYTLDSSLASISAPSHQIVLPRGLLCVLEKTKLKRIARNLVRTCRKKLEKLSNTWHSETETHLSEEHTCKARQNQFRSKQQSLSSQPLPRRPGDHCVHCPVLWCFRSHLVLDNTLNLREGSGGNSDEDDGNDMDDVKRTEQNKCFSPDFHGLHLCTTLFWRKALFSWH